MNGVRISGAVAVNAGDRVRCGDTEFLHPKDGVFPEKVNEGRQMVGHNARRIGQNANPASLKFSGRNTFDSRIPRACGSIGSAAGQPL